MNELIKVRRSLRSHVFHCLWTAFALYKTWDTQPPAKYFWGVFLAIALALIARVLTGKSYLELNGQKLTIYRDYFTSETIEVQDIDHLEIAESPFSSSKIF